MTASSSPDVTSRPYALEEFSWPAGTTTLTYSFNDFIISSDVGREDSLGFKLTDERRDLVREAIAAWENVCGVDFVEVPDSAAANIRIGWQPESGAPAEYLSDGAGGTLGITWTWYFDTTTDEVSIAFDLAESWTDELFYDTALHELGHAMGIDHSNVSDVVMSGPPLTEYADQVGRDQLSSDDIAAAQALWGSPNQSTAGDDTLRGGSGRDTIYGGAGNDYIDGGGDADFLYGGTGNDLLSGGPGNDLIAGQAGNDSLFGDEGNDRLWGGGGDDSFLGGTGNDLLGGSTGNDFLAGEAGNDTLAGQAGEDTLAGNEGNDRLWGGGGDDTLLGNEGRDLLVSHHGDDLLGGGEDNDTLAGQEGNDTLVGDSGDDRLYGGLGNDGLGGGEGNDTLYGFAGDDRLNGGEGNDFLSGDTGSDIFVFAVGHGHDTIRDFTDGEDLIDISALPHSTGMYHRFFEAVAGGVELDLSPRGGGTILLRGVDLDDVDETDFIL